MAEAAGGPATAIPGGGGGSPAVGTTFERGEAPVKQEFVRSIGARVHVGAVCGGRLPATQAGLNVQAQPQAVRGKSKKQAKKVRSAWQGEATPLHLLVFQLRLAGEQGDPPCRLPGALWPP